MVSRRVCCRVGRCRRSSLMFERLVEPVTSRSLGCEQSGSGRRPARSPTATHPTIGRPRRRPRRCCRGEAESSVGPCRACWTNSCTAPDRCAAAQVEPRRQLQRSAPGARAQPAHPTAAGELVAITTTWERAASSSATTSSAPEPAVRGCPARTALAPPVRDATRRARWDPCLRRHVEHLGDRWPASPPALVTAAKRHEEHPIREPRLDQSARPPRPPARVFPEPPGPVKVTSSWTSRRAQAAPASSADLTVAAHQRRRRTGRLDAAPKSSTAAKSPCRPSIGDLEQVRRRPRCPSAHGYRDPAA